MAKWLPSFGRKQQADAPKTVLELMVLEGEDAGQQFTVDGPEVRIGRGKPQTGQTGTILLHDTSVSAHQATIRVQDGTHVIEHNPEATNATLLNGRRIRKERIRPGDHIQMGLEKIEVRQRKGIALSGLFSLRDAETEPIADVANVRARIAESRGEAAQETAVMARGEGAATQTTLVESRGRLLLVRGIPGLENESFPLRVDSTVVGRSSQCDVTLPEPGISRQHVRFEWRDAELVLVHLSGTNSTCVAGARVTGERRLREGDEIQLADQVVLRVQLGPTPTSTEDRPTLPPQSSRPTLEPTVPPAARPDPSAGPKAPATPSLRQFMEQKLEHDRLIEEEFSVEGSFVDIDVVGSYKMKAEADRPAHIIVSFERFRSFVESVIDEFGGQVLNSNGDELMCFFESTHDAVRSASAILHRLDEFNAKQNVLASPFRFRIGIHTGRSLVDRARGVAYSHVLDTAGHLQKAADVNGLLVSEATLRALPEGLPFEPAGTLDHEGIVTFRATGPIA